jgi:putative acetyltransferase
MPIEVARKWAEKGSATSMLQRLQETEVWIAEVQGRIVGWVGVRGGDYLDALYVDPEYARRGVGSGLLRLVEDMLRRRGVSVIRADASWNAEDFYLGRGYEPLGPRPPDDARPMRKRLLAGTRYGVGVSAQRD